MTPNRAALRRMLRMWGAMAAGWIVAAALWRVFTGEPAGLPFESMPAAWVGFVAGTYLGARAWVARRDGQD